MHVGQVVRYHNPLYGHYNQLGIVVHETEGAWKVSIQKFDGHYMCILKTDQYLETLEKVSPEETLSLVANFHDRWYAQHKIVPEHSAKQLAVKLLADTAYSL